MKKSISSLLLMVLCAGVYAQAPDAAAPSADAERARITSERGRLEAGFAAEDAVCHERFFVNICLDAVNVKRREVMGDLRRQEISLNDQERRLKGAEQIRKTEEKNSPATQQADADRRAQALRDFEDRTEREKQKEASRTEAAGREKSSAEAAADRLKASQDKATSRAGKKATETEETKKFNERQQEALDRKAKKEQEKLAQTKPPAKSLPTPD